MANLGTTTSERAAPSISTQAAEQGAKHTPGPWKVVEHDQIQVHGEKRAFVCRTGQRWAATVIAERARANAHLISATPELREVCASFSVIENDGQVLLRIRGTTIVGIEADTTEAKVLLELGRLRREAISKATGAQS